MATYRASQCCRYGAAVSLSATPVLTLPPTTPNTGCSIINLFRHSISCIQNLTNQNNTQQNACTTLTLQSDYGKLWEGRPARRSRSVGHEGLHCAGAQATDSRENHAMPPVADFVTAFALVIFLIRLRHNIAWHVDNESGRKLRRNISALLRKRFREPR